MGWLDRLDGMFGLVVGPSGGIGFVRVILLSEPKAIGICGVMVCVKQEWPAILVDSRLEACHKAHTLLHIASSGPLVLLPLAICVTRVEKQKPVHVLRLALNVLLVLSGLRQLVQRVTGHRTQRLRPPNQHIIVNLLTHCAITHLHRPLGVQPTPQLSYPRDPLQLVYLLLSHFGGDGGGRLAPGAV